MKGYFLMVLTVLFMAAGTSPAYAREKTVVGYAEKVRIYPGNLEIRARIDTGAKLASLHCNCITPIKRNGEDWVDFSVTNVEGKVIHLQRKIHRIAKIKRHFGKAQERYVIKLGICLANKYKETEVSLINRAGLTYPMLIGRKFMSRDFLVDTEDKYLQPATCKVPDKK